MGGEHHEPYKIPHWTTHSNWRSSPDLLDYHNRLARLGLKDPWIRNFWPTFDPSKTGYRKRGRRWLLFWAWKKMAIGIKPGFAIAGSVVAMEELYSKLVYGHTSWGGIWAEHKKSGH
uniref:Uncharacterized protein n=1 Tax=Meloidogyne enterolobii TaxID=390850 RepID=A0A6V7XYN9_MELEN|nr:unnamed protein product [Meloidogyne enterolobii]